jgi:hypothetical protein
LGPRVITRVPNTTTLYGAGYEYTFTNIGTFWKSVDDGVTWTGTFPLLASGLGATFFWISNATSYGNAIASKNGVLLIGGRNGVSSIVRSVDGGGTWAAVTGVPAWWSTAFNTDTDRWIFAGSSIFYPGFPWVQLEDVEAQTLAYSDDAGVTWSLTSGGFNYFADQVIYGNGLWIAGGRQGVGESNAYVQFRSSPDGDAWTSFTLPTTIYPIPAELVGDESLSTVLNSILYDGVDYVILLAQIVNAGIDDVYSYYSYTHAADGSSLNDGWVELAVTTLDDASSPLRMKGKFPVSTGVPTPILSFPSQVGNGPTVTSPTSSSILLYQYAAMTPITFSATGTGTIYVFVLETDLPRGLTFNSVTNTLSGTPMLIGTNTATFYVKDDAGVTEFKLETRVIIPSIERQQTSAGAWTSLIRQYTVVNAAQNSLNGKTLPATRPPLGEFMRPPPPDVVNEPVCKKC